MSLTALWLVAMPLAIILEGAQSKPADWLGTLPGMALLSAAAAFLLYPIVLVQLCRSCGDRDRSLRRCWGLALWIGWASAVIVISLLAIRPSPSGFAGMFGSTALVLGSILLSVHIWGLDACGAARLGGGGQSRSLATELAWTFPMVVAASLLFGVRPAATISTVVLAVRITGRLQAIRRIAAQTGCRHSTESDST